MKVLIAEDDRSIREGLEEILQAEGYLVVAVADGKSAIDTFVAEKPDFICLDIMMPGMSGYDVCKEIRTINQEVPVVFISAKSEEIDKVLGLELGADDYILKPFGVKEVVARIRAITRRVSRKRTDLSSSSKFLIGDLEVDPAQLRAYRSGDVIDLSLREVSLLEYFAGSKGEVLSRDMLLDKCWGQNYFPNSRTLDQTISNLRKKIEVDSQSPQIIQTVHGAGYRYQ